MADRADLALLTFLAASLAIAALAVPGQAGTADAPEITDAAGDQEIVGTVPVDTVGFTSADVVAAWLEETADALLVNIDLSGTGNSGAGGAYTWTFHADAGGTALDASATSTASQPTPGGSATAAALDGGIVTLTIPRSALGAAATLDAIYIEAAGGTPADPVAVRDTAPDDGADAGISYTVTGGGAGSAPGDSDGDGLDDAKENATFGDLSQNGTADPDQDGLNNSREFELGTNATTADTDGDGLDDGDDSAPLDPRQPALRPGEDRDGDGLNDTWEAEHFNGTAAQSGSGDPDADTLNNTRELALGTDPNSADTDGDGRDDAEDSDPLRASASSASALDASARLELRVGALMFAAAATFCLLGLARGI